MTAAAAPRSDLRPALAGSVALHLGVIGAALIAWKFSPPAPPPKPVVPVTIVSGPSAPEAAPPVEAEKPTPATAPEPEPQPAPQPPAEMEAPAPPKPTPPPPRPYPRPAPMKAEPKPAPPPPTPAKPVAKPQPKQPALNLDALASTLPKSKPQPRPKDLDLGALASSLPKTRPQKVARNDLDLNALTSSLPTGSRHAATQRGPARAEAGPSARPAAASLTGDEAGALRSKLMGLWTLNCAVEGASSVVVKVEIRLSADGRLIGSPKVVQRTGSKASEDVINVSADRALAAVRAGEPYTELSHQPHWFSISFNAKDACSGR